VRSDGCVMSQRPTHDTEESTSRVVPPAPDAAVSELEQGLRRPEVLRTLHDEAQAEQALWQEFCAHSASLNTTLTEALRLHGGPSFQLFEVSIFAWFGAYFSCLSCPRFSRSDSSLCLLVAACRSCRTRHERSTTTFPS
jgi:hypothetical protein